MKLKQVEYVLAVAEAGSFTGAARQCHTVQSALSHQVAQLERELGVTLFERNSRSVRLTEAGRVFVQQGRQALEAVQRITDEVVASTGEVRGRLSMGTISTLTSPDPIELLARFHRRFPHVRVELVMEGSEKMLAKMEERRLDVAFIGVWPGETVPSSLCSRSLCNEELVALMSPSHPLTAHDTVTLGQLASCPVVDFPVGSSAHRQSAEAFAAQGLEYNVQFEVSTVQHLVAIVRQGLAVGLIPQSLSHQLTDVSTRRVDNAPQRSVRVVWPKTASPATRALLALLAVEDEGAYNGPAPSSQ